MFDIWNEQEPLIEEQYHKNNYEIVDYAGDDARDICVIYFSSNGLYYPNTEESFRKFMASDRYEWRRHHFQKARREIFVRDIFKQWYIKGINAQISSVNLVVGMLKNNIPAGCEVITVGNSAGGYMAVLAGCLLQASRVYSFSGQYSVEDALEDEDEKKNSLFKKYASDEKASIYLNTVPYIKRSPNTRIFYFYPEMCAEDIRQSMLVRECENVHFFAFDDDKHGRTMYNFNLDDVFELPEDKLIMIEDKMRNTKVSRFKFSVYAAGLGKTLIYMIRKVIKR